MNGYITNHQNILISTQVVNEVCSNLIRKAGFNKAQIQILLEELAQGCEILPVSLETLQYAIKLRDRYWSGLKKATGAGFQGYWQPLNSAVMLPFD